MCSVYRKSLKSSCVAFLLIISGIITLIASQADGQTSIIDAIQKSLPAIVAVKAVNAEIYKSPHGTAAFDKKTGRFLVSRKLRTAHYDRVGAGVIIDASGLIATNAHTVSQADKLTVTLQDGTKIPAHIVLIVPDYDCALIRIKPPYPLHVIEIADSNSVRLRDDIVAVGNSPLLKQTLLGGRVIGIGTSSTAKQKGIADTALIHTSINLYKGDSGGPVLDDRGRLIGLMVAGQLNIDHSSFAIPSNVIKKYYMEYRPKGTQ